MDLNLFMQPEPTSLPLDSFLDTNKIKEILEKLYEKRKVLEENIKICDETTREIYSLELLEIEKDMKTLGVSEIDYEIYIASQKEILP